MRLGNHLSIPRLSMPAPLHQVCRKLTFSTSFHRSAFDCVNPKTDDPFWYSSIDGCAELISIITATTTPAAPTTKGTGDKCYCNLMLGIQA
jgi:hypothetical protein